MAMLGAYLEITGALPGWAVDIVLSGFFSDPEVLDRNRKVLEAGRAQVRDEEAGRYEGDSP